MNDHKIQMSYYYAELYGQAAQLARMPAAAPARGAQLVWGQLLACQGWCTFQIGRPAEARALLQQSLAIERELGNRWGMVFPLISLGRVAQAQGDYRSAQRYFPKGLAIRQGFGDTRGVALCLQYLGDTAHVQAVLPEAGWFYHEALAGATPARARALGRLVQCHPAATQGSRDRAAALLASIRVGAAEPPEQEQAEPDLASVVVELL